MSVRSTVLKGTLILTLTGFATRFMGFFYRMFLSRTFGEEGVGLYQLIFPVYALCFSLTSAGIEVALSRCVAKCMSAKNEKKARSLLTAALALSVCASVIVMLFLQKYAWRIAVRFLNEKRCAGFLIVLSYSFPFASVHSCIVGYCLGLKDAKVPAFSQLIEQTARILSVYLLYLFGLRRGVRFGISIAVAGLVAGELASSVYCLKAIGRISGPRKKDQPDTIRIADGLRLMRELVLLSCPLTASRVLLNLLQSIEAVSIPLCLQQYGHSISASLSIYGVLTGMALPCILFPSAVTNSVSTMLLPTVAEVQALNRRRQMRSIIKKSACSCILLGSACCICLLASGKWIGRYLFGSGMAGDFIVILAWMCPFLYTNTTLISIINGIGHTAVSFFINTLSLAVRIASVFVCIPLFGIRGYLWGLLASQLCIFLLSILCIARYLSRPKVQ